MLTTRFHSDFFILLHVVTHKVKKCVTKIVLQKFLKIIKNNKKIYIIYIISLLNIYVTHVTHVTREFNTHTHARTHDKGICGDV